MDQPKRVQPLADSKKRHRPYQRHPKPPYSYIALIAEAIRSSASGRLTLAEINEYLMKKFPFFRGEYQGWRNSIRHNLSLNECFVKVLRDPSRPWGKDNYWILNPNTEYTFADGVFKRRRRRVVQAEPPSKDRPRKNSFRIDDILADDMKGTAELPLDLSLKPPINYGVWNPLLCGSFYTSMLLAEHRSD